MTTSSRAAAKASAHPTPSQRKEFAVQDEQGLWPSDRFQAVLRAGKEADIETTVTAFDAKNNGLPVIHGMMQHQVQNAIELFEGCCTGFGRVIVERIGFFLEPERLKFDFVGGDLRTTFASEVFFAQPVHGCRTIAVNRWPLWTWRVNIPANERLTAWLYHAGHSGMITIPTDELRSAMRILIKPRIQNTVFWKLSSRSHRCSNFPLNDGDQGFSSVVAHNLMETLCYAAAEVTKGEQRFVPLLDRWRSGVWPLSISNKRIVSYLTQ